MDSSCARRPRSRGFTLVEIVAVVAVLAIAGLVLIPTLNPSQPYKLDLVASQIAESIRFAQGEALRTQTPYGVEIDTATNRFRVFRDTSALIPPTPVFDVYHPVSKTFYDLDLEANSATSGVQIAAAPVWIGACTRPDRLGFDAHGTPRCGEPWNIRLQTSRLTVTYQGHTRTIVIDGEVGRVTVL